MRTRGLIGCLLGGNRGISLSRVVARRPRRIARVLLRPRVSMPVVVMRRRVRPRRGRIRGGGVGRGAGWACAIEL